jgi:phage replication O-like protein O
MKELKPNFTQVPNVLLDDFMSQVDSDTFKVLMVICRKIYGYHKDSDRISLSQLQSISGLTRKMVKKAIRILIERKVLYILENETRTHARRYTLILSENSTWIPQEPSVDPSGTLTGSHKDPHEDPTETLQNKKKENKQNIFLNKEAEYQKNKHSEIAVKEYIVNNNVGDAQPSRITNQINEWFITLWKEYYKMPYKADLFETERLAVELNHDWESFLLIVKSYQDDPFWAKISMSPKMLRKAWDKLGSRAKVSENQSREIRRKEIDTYEQKILEHEQHKKELKQVADNWKPWNLKADFEKMVGGK